MKLFAFLGSLVLMSCLAGAALAAAPEAESPTPKGGSGMPVPRFSALKTGEVNMRTGPGTRYPIVWVFTRPGLPVEVIAEYDVWRHVRDPDGDEGWVHESELSNRRTVIVTGGSHDLRARDNDTAAVLAHVGAGVTGRLLSCHKTWCRVKFDDLKGWLPKSAFWGAYPDEAFD